MRHLILPALLGLATVFSGTSASAEEHTGRWQETGERIAMRALPRSTPALPGRATPAQAGYICGPDLTTELYGLLDQVIYDFRYTLIVDSQQRLRCDALVDLRPTERGSTLGEVAWDLKPFFPPYRIVEIIDYHESPRQCATPWDQSDGAAFPCGGTIAFEGECVHASVANYIFWGVAFELCGEIDADYRTEMATLEYIRNNLFKRLGNLVSSDGVPDQWIEAMTESQDLMIDLGAVYAAYRRAMFDIEDLKRAGLEGTDDLRDAVDDARDALEAFEEAREEYVADLNDIEGLRERACATTCSISGRTMDAIRGRLDYRWLESASPR